jgi:fructuronate reductase
MTVASALPRLSPATLVQAKHGTILPSCARPDPGIVHLGLGAFVRAHLATYTDDLLAVTPGAWGITGVSLRRPDQRDRLAPQDGLYTAVQREGEGIKARIIGCLRATLVAPEAPAQVLEAMVDPACRVVSLTVTEKGYCHEPATGRLDQCHPDIVSDLQNPAAPRSAVGFLVRALERRRAVGHAPFTVLCCDNLPHNGRLLTGLVQDFAALYDDRLAGWIASEVAFPSTMVDRIVPATTAADLVDAAQATGLRDAAPVVHEPFRQWVVEDRFVAGTRPGWDRVGTEFVTEVAPYEHMKLRLLNGAHSALAYLGYLAGHETIADTVADDALRAYLQRLWEQEIIPVVPAPPGVDLRAYTGQLLARFSNRAIRHRTWQIAMDGSQKLPQRLLASIRERLARGLPISCLALAVAAWIRYVGGMDEAGRPIDVQDPLAARLRAALDAAGDDPATRVAAILGIEAVFDRDLPQAPTFVASVTDAYARLLRKGARRAASRTATA